ncbi:hypothetical protein [Intestinicryptomonas porci]|uniref:Uncharacterized protein n=1 Tax=Intestinicryptomonas porci TaxID=2926320 RepID=A0ABU4WFK7_9BACT|nr:hypothetical protein [Opitutales bacterium CLA-KB-P66]
MTETSAIFDATSAAGSAAAGYVATLLAQLFAGYQSVQKQNFELLKQKIELADSSADKAATRDGSGGKIIRRLIYFGCAFTIMVAPFIFAFFNSIPVEVEEKVLCGGWFWGLVPEWSNTVFHKINGFYLPSSIQHAFISFLIPFYLGRGAAK